MNMKISNLSLLAILLISTSTLYAQNMSAKPPKAKKIPETFKTHGDTRIDNYHWMRLSDEQKEAQNPDDQTKEVLNYLRSENDYLKASLSHTEALQEELFNEITARFKQDESSVPYEKDGYRYYTRYEKGKDYPLYCRRKDGEEFVMLNTPAMANQSTYFAIGSYAVSPNTELLAYSVDRVSRRQYTIEFKDLSKRNRIVDKIENTDGSIVWANDNKTIFYTKNDPVTLRSYRIYKHVLGTDQSEDVLVFEEKDETFNCHVFKTKSEAYIMIGSHQTMSSEYRYIPADEPNAQWQIFSERERGHEYNVDHLGNEFYIVTNWKAQNFRLMKTMAAAKTTAKENSSGGYLLGGNRTVRKLFSGNRAISGIDQIDGKKSGNWKGRIYQI